MLRLALVILALAATAAHAGPFLPAGDIALRHDIQLLADHGVISGPVTSWPLAWGPLLADLGAYDASESLPANVNAAYRRVRMRARQQAKMGTGPVRSSISIGADPMVIRGFSNTPREDFEATAGFSWLGERFSMDLAGTIVEDPADGQDFRADGSAISMALGNWTLALSTQERWWGPAWDGSLILSNNARPMPAIVLDRTFNDPFETKWLSWLGPWDLSVMMGQLEADRFVPDALFFGMRFAFRPTDSLEIALSRGAQWCGDGRPCNFDTFADLLLGKDNVGSSGIDPENEPGNQLAGLDVRWTSNWFNRNVSLYGQFIGEDEAGGLPSRYLGILGMDGSGTFRDNWSLRWYGEVATTSCDFYASDELFDCAYTSGIYQTGYRYRGRAIGHGLDADSRVVSGGVVLVSEENEVIHALARFGALNRGTLPDGNHTLAPLRQEIASIDVSYKRNFGFGEMEIGAGFQRLEDEAASATANDGRLYLRWQRLF